MRKLNENNIEKLTKDKKKFLNRAKKMNFDGPTKYFYLRVIEGIRTKNNDYSSLFSNTNNLFIEYLYATLTAWGMHRMNNTKMVPFEDFKNSIIENKKKNLRSCLKRD